MIRSENNMYKAEVAKINALSPDSKAIRFRFMDKKEAKDFVFLPGQFVMAGILGYGEATLAITSTMAELPEVEVVVRSLGVATQAMHRLKVGDLLYLRGPFGNSIFGSDIYGKQVILIAGGLGLAPLRTLINMVASDGTIVDELKIVYGAKTPEHLLFKADLAKWGTLFETHLVVDRADPQWSGELGRVTDSLEKIKVKKDAVAVICGPPIMYAGVAKTLLSLGLTEENIYFSLERRMKCGIGKCQHCTCGEKYVCLDGPIFTWKELASNWEALASS
jgi:sulfhydrogenase subunit gamma (sulfur reductase)